MKPVVFGFCLFQSLQLVGVIQSSTITATSSTTTTVVTQDVFLETGS